MRRESPNFTHYNYITKSDRLQEYFQKYFYENITNEL